MDEKERAELNKTQADRDAVYLANGVISQEEVRQRLSLDRYSGYTMIDVDDVPEPQEQPLENTNKEEQDEEDRQAMDEWVESSVDEKSNDLTEDSSMWSKVKEITFDWIDKHKRIHNDETNRFERKRLKLSKQEYAHVISEIRTFATKEQQEKGFFIKFIGNNFYFVECSEERDYIIVGKGKIK